MGVRFNTGVLFPWNLGVAGISVAMENMFTGIRAVFSVADEKCDPASDERFSQYHHQYYVYTTVIRSHLHADVLVKAFSGWNLHHGNSYHYRVFNCSANHRVLTKGTVHIIG